MVERNFHKQVRQSANLVYLQQRARCAFRVRCVCQKNALNPVRQNDRVQTNLRLLGRPRRAPHFRLRQFVSPRWLLRRSLRRWFFPVLEQRRTFWDACGLDSDLGHVPNRCRLTKIHVSVGNFSAWPQAPALPAPPSRRPELRELFGERPGSGQDSRRSL
jgi:hypothetical protein